MSAPKITALLDGVARLQRAVELTDTRTRARTVEAIRRGAERVTAQAESRAPKKSGELASAIRPEFSKDGMVGWVKAGYGVLPRTVASKAMGPASRQRAIARRDRLREAFKSAGSSRQAMRALDLGVYAPVVERGDKRRNKPKRPFLIPAFVTEKPSIITDLAKAPELAGREAGL